MSLGGGLTLGIGLSLRPYGNGSSTPVDPDFASVTVLYGFEQSSFATGVTNDGSLAAGTVEDNGVAPSTAQHIAGLRSAAFNQNGTTSNDGIIMGTTANVLGSGAFTIEGWIRHSAAFNALLFSCGVDNDTSNRLNIDLPSTRAISCVFGAGTTRTSSTNVWPVDDFFHFAFVYETTPAFRCYVNGTSVLTGTDSFVRSGNACLGRHINLSQPVSGPNFLDELRISKVARYTGSSFIVPTPPFPRS